MAVSQFLGDVGAALGSSKASNLPGVAKQAMNRNLGGGLLAPMDMPFEMASMERQQPMQQPMKQQMQQPGGGLLGFFGRPGTKDAMGQIGDYLLESNDMQPIYGPRKAERERRMIGDKLAQYLGTDDPVLGEIARIHPEAGMAMLKMRQEQQNKLALEQEQARLKASQPDISTINNRRVKIDPTTGEAQVLYTAPQDFDDYAASLGAEPGTPEYQRLVQDYVLRSAGPTATDYNLEEEGVRQGNRVSLEGVRQKNRTALRGTPTYRQANPAPRSPVGGRGSAQPRYATNPQTGERLELKGGKWVPAKGGQTATPSGGFR